MRLYKNLVVIGATWLISAMAFADCIDDTFITTIGILGGGLTFLMGAVNLWEE